MAVLEITGLKKSFDEVRAVDGVDLSIRESEFLVILGPSGCGKTTFMRMIAGLEEPTAGEIFIDGERVNDLPPRARNVAMVFQSYALYPHMTVFDNIAFPVRAQAGSTKESVQQKVEWAATLLDVMPLLDRKPRQLSGGERQRVALCRALVKEPSVLLLDEPLSNLDAKLRASARDELQRFQRRLGITTIFVTHDQVEAMGLGDRIVVMHAGTIRQIGTPQEVYHDSADTFVATFLGSPGMNLVEREEVLVGFRPEQFVPVEVCDVRFEPQIFRFRVSRAEYLGADQLIYGTLADSPVETPVIARLSSEHAIPIQGGQVYDFAVQKQQLRFFDAESGLRTGAVPL